MFVINKPFYISHSPLAYPIKHDTNNNAILHFHYYLRNCRHLSSFHTKERERSYVSIRSKDLKTKIPAFVATPIVILSPFLCRHSTTCCRPNCIYPTSPNITIRPKISSRRTLNPLAIWILFSAPAVQDDTLGNRKSFQSTRRHPWIFSTDANLPLASDVHWQKNKYIFRRIVSVTWRFMQRHIVYFKRMHV